MKKWLLFSILLTSVSQSLAYWIDGNSLKRSCDIESGFNDGMCLGYIFGVTEMLDRPPTIDSNTGSLIGKRYVCIPSGVVGAQLQAVTRKFLLENPDKLHWPANILVNNALIAAFPCRQ